MSAPEPGPAGVTVALASRDLGATDRLLVAGLGLATAGAGRYLLGPDVVLAVHPATGQAGPTELTLHPGPGAGATGELAAGVFGGVPIRCTADPLTPPAEPPKAGNTLGLDHIGVAASDTAGLVAELAGLGFGYESRQIDTQLAAPIEVFSSDRYGVVSHAGPPRQAGALLVTFLRRDGVHIEILQDIMSAGPVQHSPTSDGPGSTTGDNRAIARFVARRGGGLHHLAVRVRDIGQGIGRLTGAGIPMIDTMGRPGSRRSLIAFADRRGTGGLVLHLVQREDPPDP
ncbi:MAG TPA: VOC family protein [Pseudonocardia sp.]|nr:VOC family protein [Pseudonocardia sp.]